MPQVQTNLNNTSNNVTITVAVADNLMSIYLNPDLSPVNGFTQVYETLNFGAAGTGATLSLQGYLNAYKSVNRNARSVALVICMSNFEGGGSCNYKIAGPGISLTAQTPGLPGWSSQMDSYVVNLF